MYVVFINALSQLERVDKKEDDLALITGHLAWNRGEWSLILTYY